MAEIAVASHPIDAVLRRDRLPHIWCPGCGIGAVMACYARAILESGIPLDKHICVSGIGCSARVPGYMNLDTYHTTHGRAIPFATGLKLVNPELQVTVFSGDGDLFAIGGNHFIHAARRNIDINVFCVNNFNYGMTGGQAGPTTPMGSFTTTTPYGNVEPPFNLAALAAACGAVFVARWTALHVRQAQEAMQRAMQKKGFAFVEIVAPCPVSFGKSNDIGEGVDEMWMYRKQCVVNDDADVTKIDVTMGKEAELVVGNFLDIERPAYMGYGKEVLGEA
ncbi:MAG: thiamine pyrophosphate-dependent enzyme [Chloroflexota bacterium]|nr:thiamine pyrophosphate-dependent enzyme [Chloroflexota bacterium]